MTYTIKATCCEICDTLRQVADLTSIFGFPMCRDREACHRAYLDREGWTQEDYDNALRTNPAFVPYGDDDGR